MKTPHDRRTFLKTTGAAGGLMIAASKTAFGADANSRLQLGLIGCGGRGPWIADFFEKHTNTKCVAVCDYFRNQVQAAGTRFGIAADRQYVGLDGYKELIASEVDAVAVESPAYFHPEHAVAALEAGKHVYLAKPIAIDVPGCLAIVEAAKKHGAKCSTVVDFQTRKTPAYQKVAKAVHEGAIGEPVCGQAYYYAPRLNIRTKPGTDVAKLRNWFFEIALAGDIIVEQNVHTVDVANWFLQGHPVKAHGIGGRRVRTDVGDSWDHFIVTYTYPNDVLIAFSSAQFTTGFGDICTRICGSDGTVEAHYFKECWVDAKRVKIPSESTGNIYSDGAIANVKEFHQSIVDGKYLNNTQESADSTMSCVLGRMAAYEGKTITWDEMLKRNERLDPKLDLPANGPDLLPEPV